MKTKNRQTDILFLAVGAIGVLLLCAWLSSPTRAAPMIPPPIPTMTLTPAPKPTSPPSTGGLIELQAQFPQTWPWDEVHGQELWTIVQWRDDKGYWRDVEGWQGTLDAIATGEDGDVVGYKTWWVAKTDSNRGPFRWVVYKSRDGAALVRSESFYLPDATSKTVIEVALKP
ncbi:MAG: hypothetical protein SXV54_26190 [Chloroflexota bacterium]|nr:hypothetical protein [Chloroflexota bacterium]